jgi:hypothetical protein
MRPNGLGFSVLAALLLLPMPLSAHESPREAATGSEISPSARGAAAAVDAFHSALRRGDTRAAAAVVAEDA